MDAAQFQRALIVVLIVGSVMTAVGTGVLYIAFRGFGNRRHFAMVGAVVAFIFVCCFVLFATAFLADR